MLLHRTPIMELHYEPKTDIMRVNWPDLKDAELYEVASSFELIRVSISSYYIKRLLIDSRQSSHVPDMEQLRQVTLQFMKALAGTGLKKVARIQSLTAAREAMASNIISQITPDSRNLHIEFQNFNDEQEAIDWLLKEE